MILNDLAKWIQLLALNLNYSEKIRLIFFWQGLIHSNLTMCFSKPIVGFIFSPNFIWEGKIFRELLKKVSSLLLNYHFISGFEFAFASVFMNVGENPYLIFFVFELGNFEIRILKEVTKSEVLWKASKAVLTWQDPRSFSLLSNLMFETSAFLGN